MIEFLIFGGFWFWAIFGLASFILLMNVIFSERLKGIWFFGIVLMALFVVSGGISFAWLIANPVTVLIWVAIYIAVGLIWSMKEWYDFVIEKTELYSTDYYNTYKLDETKEYRYTEDEIRKNLQSSTDINAHWDDITTWIVFFPYFLLAWMATDPIKWIAKQFALVYKSISKMIVNKAVSSVIEKREANDIYNDAIKKKD